MKLATVEERNAAFAAMTPTARRKAIAADVLAQVKRKKYIATQGIYVVPEGGGGWLAGERTTLAEDYVVSPDVACECCAKGAVFVSAVRLFDGACGETRIASQYAIWGESADLMEGFFEDATACGTARQRLVGIMEAVLRHPQGYFTAGARLRLGKGLTRRPARR